MNLGAAHTGDDQFEAAVVEQENVIGSDIFRQLLVIEAGAFLVAECALCVEDKVFTVDQGDLVVLELAGP